MSRGIEEEDVNRGDHRVQALLQQGSPNTPTFNATRAFTIATFRATQSFRLSRLCSQPVLPFDLTASNTIRRQLAMKCPCGRKHFPPTGALRDDPAAVPIAPIWLLASLLIWGRPPN